MASLPKMIVYLSVIGLAVAGPLIAGVLLHRRKKRMRAERRSPLTSDLLRPAGYGIQLKLDEARDQVDEWLIALLALPLLVYSVHLTQSYMLGAQESLGRILTSVLIGGTIVGWAAYRLVRVASSIDKLRIGLDAERAIGQALDQLMRSGAAVYHDIPADHCNIDHIVVCEAGVYAVETKGRSKPIRGKGSDDATVVFDGTKLWFPTWTEVAPLAQAERQAAWTAQWLSSAIGEPVQVKPVLAIPGWFIDRKGRSSVLLTNGKKVEFLLSLEGRRLSKEMIQRVAHQIEQRCRTVKPTYSK